MCFVYITAEGTVLEGVLYDNPTARGFAEILPLMVELWHPVPDFARAFDLPEQIAAKGKDGLNDAGKLRPISFDPVHNDYLALGEKVGSAFSDGNALK